MLIKHLKLFFLIVGILLNLFSCIERCENTTRLNKQDNNSEAAENSENTLNKVRLKKWGLGENLTTQKSNNVGYNWYIDQIRTGMHYGENCGPTVATMAIMWTDSNFNKSPVEARESYVSGGGDWYTSDIIAYLNDNQISNYILKLNSDKNQLKQVIDSDNIAVLCIDTYQLDYTFRKNWHKNRFYKTRKKGNGHFIIVKGYIVVDDILYFEVYDPFSMGKTYSNNSPKGVDRYYTEDNINKATKCWWNYAIVVTRKQLNKKNKLIIPKEEHKPGSYSSTK